MGFPKAAHREVRPSNQKYTISGIRTCSAEFEVDPEIGRTKPKFGGEAEIGRANLLVSRIILFAIIDLKIILFAGVYEKRLAARFALPIALSPETSC